MSYRHELDKDFIDEREPLDDREPEDNVPDAVCDVTDDVTDDSDKVPPALEVWWHGPGAAL